MVRDVVIEESGDSSVYCIFPLYPRMEEEVLAFMEAMKPVRVVVVTMSQARAEAKLDKDDDKVVKGLNSIGGEVTEGNDVSEPMWCVVEEKLNNEGV